MTEIVHAMLAQYHKLWARLCGAAAAAAAAFAFAAVAAAAAAVGDWPMRIALKA